MQGHFGDNHQGGHQGGHDAETTTSWTTLTSGTAAYAGTSGQDWLYLGAAGATLTVSAVEKLAGGVGTDVVTLGSAGATLCVANLETLIGGVGTDVVQLAAAGATLAVSGIETLQGSGGSDVITVAAGTVRYVVRGDGANVTLAADNGADQVVLGDGGPGFANSAGYNQISQFQTGVDQLVLTGGLRARLDDDRDGVVDSASAATGAIDVSTAEVVKLTTTVATLTDADLASVRSGIGTLLNSSARADVLVLASDGTNSGAYLVTDANGDGQVAATEIKLLGVFKNTPSLAVGDLTYG